MKASQMGNILTKAAVYGINLGATGSVVLVAIMSNSYKYFKHGFVDLSQTYRPYVLM